MHIDLKPILVSDQTVRYLYDPSIQSLWHLTQSLSTLFVFEKVMGAGSYTKEVASSHKRFQTALKRAKSRQAVLNVYWKHKKEHERLLKKHLKEEFRDVNKIKNRLKYR